MLAKGLQNPISAHIVCGSKEEGSKTANQLKSAGIEGDYTVSNGGFTDLIARRELRAFLGSPGR